QASLPHPPSLPQQNVQSSPTERLHYQPYDAVEGPPSNTYGLMNGYPSTPKATFQRTGSPASIYSLNSAENKTSPSSVSAYGRGSESGSPPNDPYALSRQVDGFVQDAPPPRLTHHPTPSMRYVPQTDVSRNRSTSNSSTYSNVSAEDH